MEIKKHKKKLETSGWQSLPLQTFRFVGDLECVWHLPNEVVGERRKSYQSHLLIHIVHFLFNNG